ncbi:hypothetical protein ElyMa_006482500 [Elysia marginata]|uniref:Uncharacterized protein n=1 Tax=Elysia marginata TaxID=1093978 RepID=A0AAV4I1X4_9GAST|nr:hypothetical protein ElyMa_006482500 [Elysia marginata]
MICKDKDYFSRQNNVANSEVSHENRLSDVVKGLPRVQGGVSSVGGGTGLGGPRGPSSSPSPVATPGLGAASSQINHQHHPHQRGMSNQTADSDTSGAQDDADTASSSQEDADIEGGSGEVSTVSSGTSDSRANAVGRGDGAVASEPHSHAAMTRSNKASAPVTSGGGVGGRSIESRQGAVSSTASSGNHYHQTGRGPQPAVQSPLLSPTSVAAAEAPKPSYAQIAQKTANVSAASGNETTAAGVPATQAAVTGQVPASSSTTTTTISSSAVSAQNGPSPSVSSHQLPGNGAPPSGRNSTGGGNGYNQSPNHGYQREHSGGNYRPGQHRAGSGGPSTKDNFQGSPLYQRPPNSNNNNINHSSNNSRRNAKDKFTPNSVNNKYDRRKPDTRQK